MLRSVLQQGIDKLQIQQVPAPSDAVIDRLVAFVLLMNKWNAVYNLTAIRDPQEMIAKHLLDSLVLNRWLFCDQSEELNNSQQSDASDVLDAGSGAGLPVIPLAICHPQRSFVSVEANGKKARFQQQAIIELGLKNVQLLEQRLQNVSHSARWITSRALTAPADFLSMVDHLCLSCTRVILMLGQSERLPSSLPAPFELEQLLPVDIPGVSAKRHIAVCRRR